MKFAFLLIILEAVCFASSGGNLIVICGPGNTGKSTTQKVLCGRDSRWQCVDEDGLFFSGLLSALQQHFPKDALALKEAIHDENIYHAIERNLVCFKPQATCEQKEVAYEAIKNITRVWHDPQLTIRMDFAIELRNKITQNMCERFENGEHIVADLVSYEKIRDGLSKRGGKVFSVLFYCSLKEMIKRQEKRNVEALQAGTMFQHRLYYYALPSFLKSFEPTQDQENAVACLTREEIRSCFEKVRRPAEKVRALYVSAHERFIRELDEEGVCNMEEKFIEKYGLSVAESVYIRPAIKVDCVIDTTKKRPEDIAQQILQMFERHA